MDMHFRFDRRDSTAAGCGSDRADAIEAKWLALHQAAAAVALAAGLPGDAAGSPAREFPAAITALGGWQLTQAEQGLGDLTAIMEPGLAALLTLSQRGADCRAAAETLLGEFSRARTALLGLLPWPMNDEHL